MPFSRENTEYFSLGRAASPAANSPAHKKGLVPVPGLKAPRKIHLLPHCPADEGGGGLQMDGPHIPQGDSQPPAASGAPRRSSGSPAPRPASRRECPGPPPSRNQWPLHTASACRSRYSSAWARKPPRPHDVGGGPPVDLLRPGEDLPADAVPGVHRLPVGGVLAPAVSVSGHPGLDLPAADADEGADDPLRRRADAAQPL